MSSDDDDLAIALALSAATSCRPPSNQTGPSTASSGRARAPGWPMEEVIELGDSSEEEIQEIAAPPARRRPTTGASSISTAPQSAHASSSSSSRQALASSSISQGGTNARNAPVTGSRGREVASARSTRRAEFDSSDDDNDIESDREPLRSVGDLTTNGLDGLDMFRSAGGQGGVRPGSGLTAGEIDRGGLPVPRREVMEEDGMDAELMLAMHKSREDEERKRTERERREALMGGTNEEEALRLAMEASLNAPPPPTASTLKRPRSPSPADDDASSSHSSQDSDNDPEKASQKQMDLAVAQSKAEKRKLVVPKASMVRTNSSGPLFDRPGLFDMGGSHNGSGRSTPVADVEMMTDEPLPSASSRTTGAKPAVAPSKETKPSATAPSSSIPSVAQLPTGPSRAQMEAERLARIQARLGASTTASSSTSTTQGRTTSPKTDSVSNPPAPKRAKISSPDKGKGREIDQEPTSLPTGSKASGNARAGGSTVPATERFWDGVLGMTHNRWATGHGLLPQGISRTFRLGDLISEPRNLHLTILSTYALEDAFIARHLPQPTLCPTILVSQPPRGHSGSSMEGGVLPGVWSCWPFLKSDYGTQHMKFMLLFYKDGRMRMVISTGNLNEHDWDFIENTVWVQDFRPRPASSKERSEFGQEWVAILKGLSVDKTFAKMKQALSPDQRARLPLFSLDQIADKWDFTSVTIQLVASLHGKYEGWAEVEKYGIARIGKVVRDQGWVPTAGKRLNSIEAQGSSLGKYYRPWLHNFLKLCQGQDPRRFLLEPKSNQYPEGIKILYPTVKTVDGTIAGRPGGGTFFCSKDKFNVCPQYFHDAKSKRGGGTLMHLKMIVAVFESIPQTLGSAPGKSSLKSPPKQTKLFADASESETDDEEGNVRPNPTSKNAPTAKEPAGGWMYIGSHNFTPSAWGTLTMAKNGPPSLNISNYELGFLFPLRAGDADLHATSIAPWQRPVQRYEPKESPWIQDEFMPKE